MFFLKRPFRIPFVCGAKNLGEALRRISEGCAFIRVKGNAGTGNVMHAGKEFIIIFNYSGSHFPLFLIIVRHARTIQGEIRALQALRDEEVFNKAKVLSVLDLFPV